MNVWDLAATWSARRWLRRLRTELAYGLTTTDLHDPTVTAALEQHVQAVRGQIDADLAAREGLVTAPYVVVLAIYAEELYREAKKAGWEPPTRWTTDDGVSLRLLACCEIANLRVGRVRH